ncbi:metaxin-1 [Perca flavescens]|uniref:metaxin-1 n=1 Tax=Perca flavescens TaxID=8167 RepID=UPI00106EB79A|nr:metaxin-1-like [Perca flavescens]
MSLGSDFQAYAQFAGAPLKLRKISNPWRSPSGSLPALRTNRTETLSRPSDIIIHLRKQKYNADYDLSAKEGADSLAFISLLEEKLKPALIYTFWVEPKNYVDVTRRWYAEHLPFPLNFFLPGRMQRRRLETLQLLRGDQSLEAGDELEKETDELQFPRQAGTHYPACSLPPHCSEEHITHRPVLD